ncbi:alpha-N-acetylneuraminide alpha-2,8-sialyltransferase-like isoform X2 [Antedon mediterranea]
MKPWKRNLSNFLDLRSELKKTVHTEMILNRHNVRQSQRFNFTFTQEKITTHEFFYKLLHEYSPEQTEYKRCSIVGNGGILNGSKCGYEIDKADFVIRCNAPPIGRFKEDAGVKSNITTVNPSIIVNRYGRAKNKGQQSRLIKDMKEYNNYIWFPSFAAKWIYDLSIKLNKLLNKNLKSVTFVHGNPNHFREIKDYWSKKHMHKLLSTGFYITTASLLFCKEVHLYGFWPFASDLHNRSTPYHYFEDLKLSKASHAFDSEFDKLLSLHKDGVLQLHVDDC